ncbi:protein shuttle craft [Trichoplusia ni]|uniref:Protein shuttle craft n=1 Tax=Trichoplusia ni TaxID=7111 RepID=A0A7E5VAD5_TRINI|nr:protein shuttle craft [Trichoplusia ni]
MSQWNNSYAYDNQYQSWNGDPNCQYANQTYYPNRAEPANQYVSFNEFLSQMQNNGAPNSANYSNVQYEAYQNRHYNYQNLPPNAQNPQLDSYGYAASSNAPNGAEAYQMNVQSQYAPVAPNTNAYTNAMILKSNLTPTATEFVPKCSMMNPSTSTQNIPETSTVNEDSEFRNNYVNVNDSRNHHSNVSDSRNNYVNTSESRTNASSKSDTNWRERPQSSQQSNEQNPRTESFQRPQEVTRSHEPNSRRNRDNNYRDYESKSRHELTGRNYESNGRHDYNNRNYDSNGRHESNSRSYESNSRYESSNHSQESDVRQNEPSGRSREPNDSNSRNYESNNRSYETSNKRGQSKQNYKSKNNDDARTFYNSSISKDSQDVRNGRGEGSGRGKNWIGSQRVRATERNCTEDEQYANTYLKEERMESREREREKVTRVEPIQSPARSKSKHQNNDQANKEMTQRERLAEQLDKGTLECLVCCDRVKQFDQVWSCTNCYHVLHLRCIRKWAMSSMVEGKWRCPACQNTSELIPGEYRCMCGAVRAPEYVRGAAGAHTCGRACRRARACPHPCTLLCHPGPCPPCQATVVKQCGCGAETRSVLCSSKLPQVCGRVCGRTLQCGVHKCKSDCHEGPCDECTEVVTQVCYCPAAKSRSVVCTAESGSCGSWSCGDTCGRVLACGAHVCRAPCHAPPCRPCALLPQHVPTCPCGNTQLPKDSRKSCTDPIPLCGNICAKPLQCGPAGDKHFCKLNCHEGPCPECPDKTVLQCRCGHSSREVPCAELPEMYNNVLCQKKCNKKLSCGRHRCRTVCCAATSHRCAVVCGRTLSCQTHRCEEFCHTGHCAPCPRVSFEELSCSCGAQTLLPPVRCGARPPACSAPCGRARACRHPPHHSCHAGDCPPCVVLTTKRCHGNHEERKTIPCSQEEFSCGLPCGKPLPCGKHTCIKTCHKGPCDTGKCTQPCMVPRPSCGHPCAAACHAGAAGAGAACPSAAPCRRAVRATCPCARRHAQRPCCDNARDYAKMMSALAATKMSEGGSVDLSDVQRPGNMLKTLECDDECRVEARTRQLALALQIRNPDVSAKLAPRYSEHVRATATREPAFAQQIHDKLTELVQLAKKSKQKTRAHSFPSMNWQKRQFIHELCEHFGCESVAYDAEPNRNVVATADKEKSWLPAMSVLEVLAREAGKRRVPGPVLRAPPAPAAERAPKAASAAPAHKQASGWATLTSTNAWAARSQPKPQPAQPAAQPQPQPQPEKIDYFDNPPEN